MIRRSWFEHRGQAIQRPSDGVQEHILDGYAQWPICANRSVVTFACCGT
jgi:hypothetical protein